MPEVELEQARGSVAGAANDLASARRVMDNRRADPAAGGASEGRAAVDGHPPGTGRGAVCVADGLPVASTASRVRLGHHRGSTPFAAGGGGGGGTSACV